MASLEQIDRSVVAALLIPHGHLFSGQRLRLDDSHIAQD